MHGYSTVVAYSILFYFCGSNKLAGYVKLYESESCCSARDVEEALE